jgi:HD-GYP domain-containing protein (c-di-GMP phosphodiesterase class II)
MIEHSRCIAQRLLLDAETINDTVLLAVFHDIGKIGICDAVLNKPGKLTCAEREIIKMHSKIGYEIMNNIPGFSAISRYILAHHEWWNGQGYPIGLRGKDIPLPCRIVSVADAYDVMISGRTYQSARSHEEALMELKRCANTQFDPMIVEMFLHLCHA